MPARRHVTARQERLGKELRKLRERAGLSIREAARSTGIDEGKLSNSEAGRVGVSAERVRHLASEYACSDPALVDALADMTGGRLRGWWEDYRELVPSGYLDLAELEHHGSHLRTFQNFHVPALLQTEEHVRAVLASSLPKLSDEEVDVRVRYRMRRQDVLVREQPAWYAAVIHEAALRIRAADRKAAQRQLRHILERSEEPQVTVRVVPFDVDGFAGLGSPMVLVGGAVPQLDTVLLDNAHGGSLADAEAQLTRYRQVLAKVEEVALGVVQSRNLIHGIAQNT